MIHYLPPLMQCTSSQFAAVTWIACCSKVNKLPAGTVDKASFICMLPVGLLCLTEGIHLCQECFAWQMMLRCCHTMQNHYSILHKMENNQCNKGQTRTTVEGSILTSDPLPNCVHNQHILVHMALEIPWKYPLQMQDTLGIWKKYPWKFFRNMQEIPENTPENTPGHNCTSSARTRVHTALMIRHRMYALR